jgi:hypothetical protein
MHIAFLLIRIVMHHGHTYKEHTFTELYILHWECISMSLSFFSKGLDILQRFVHS